MLGFDAALIIPSMKICGNKIYGIVQEHDMIVQTEFRSLLQVRYIKTEQHTTRYLQLINAQLTFSE